MPHAVFLISATFLATAAGHITGNGEGYAPQAPEIQQAFQVVNEQRTQALNVSESEILRPAAPQRWVF